MKTSRTYVCLGFFIISFTLFEEPLFGQLKAQFVSNIQSGCGPLIIEFKDQSIGNPLSWKWDLGNGTISTLQNPVGIYYNQGSYTIKLTIKNASGFDSLTKTSYITLYANPQANFAVSSTQGCYPLSVKFLANSKAGSGIITDYLWDFGDGNIFSGDNPEHIYTFQGTFNGSLKIINSYGCVNTLTKNKLINTSDGVNAQFSISSMNVCTSPASVYFKNSSTGSGTLSYEWNFGNKTTSTAAIPTSNFTSGSYNVILIAKSAGGCVDTASSLIKVSIPIASITNTNVNCSNQTIQFSNSSSPAPISNKWYFGDGSTSSDFTTNKIYAKPGTYKVKLVNIFAAGCMDSTTKNITIVAGPLLSFAANDTVRCIAPLNVKFTNKTLGNAENYLWNFGDGATSQEVSPDHIYTTQGSYTVKLTAINSNGCENFLEKENFINIKPIEISNILNLQDSGCLPFKINPTVSVNANMPMNSYKWDFGDGSTSQDAKPSHTYTEEGIFTIKTSIETAEGCTSSYISNNRVFVGHKPKAGFTPLLDTICPYKKVKVTNTSTNGPITSLSWNFGDIQDFASGEIYLYDPHDTGYLTVTLVALNYGCSDTLIRKALYAVPPFASFLITQNCNNKSLVNFKDRSIADLKHMYDFGDGKTDTSKNPIHNYTLSGIYKINLYTQNNTCRDTASNIVHIINEAGSMLLSDNMLCKGKKMVIDITGINLANIKFTKWYFGDGETQTLSNTSKTTHSYSVSGKFLITAVMTDLNGCEYYYTSKDSVTVFGSYADFTSLKTGACKDSLIIFKDNSKPDGIHQIIKWSWDYGDKIFHDYNKPTSFFHFYADTGDYTVRLFVTDNYGCTDSVQRTNYVLISHPFASFIKSDSIVCPGSQVSFKNTSTGNALKYTWFFGDRSQAESINPVYKYNIEGTFIPSLYAVDINGCKDSFTSKPLIVSKVFTQFNVTDSFSSCPPLKVNFINNSTNYTSTMWDFGDGNSSVLTSPTHTYNYPGSYILKLNLKGFGNCSGFYTKKVNIKGPTGKLVYDLLPKCYPAAINFYAPAKDTKNYVWDFNDGDVIATNTNKTNHTYNAGFFIPKLILTDSLNCKVIFQGIDTIKVYDVSASANIYGNITCDSATINFSDKSHSRDSITHHIWYFGDSYSCDAIHFTHTYKTPGTYNAKLVAVTELGCRDTFSLKKPIIILQTPVIKIIGDTVACANSAIFMKGESNNKDTLQWHWNFNNGSTASGQNISTSYKIGGIYDTRLTASNEAGCANSVSQKIKINSNPEVDAGADTSVCEKSIFHLNAAGAVNYEWQGEGLNCNNCKSPKITIDSKTIYKVTGTDTNGCKGNDSIIIKTIQQVHINALGTDTLCIGESKMFTASGAITYQWYPSVYLDDPKSANPVFTATTDTSINYKVVGYSEKNCSADTGYVNIKTFALPKIYFLKNTIDLNAGSSVKLLLNKSPGITHWQWQPAIGLDNPFRAEPIASPRQTTTYSVIASNDGGCVAHDEVTVRVLCNNESVFIPNSFSPNNDGMNETFYPRGKGLFNVKSFMIFNRWGQLLFEKYNISPNNAADGWTGKYNNQSLITDVYIYVMEIVCENGAIIPVKGNVTLLK